MACLPQTNARPETVLRPLVGYRSLSYQSAGDMPAPASTRFAVTVKGTPRNLLSVREQDNGRLIVTLQSVGNSVRDLGTPGTHTGVSTEHNVRIAHQKFSIHPSGLSATHNQLHFHQILANGTKKDRYHVTSAISSNKFAPLFVKRFSALQGKNYDLKKATNVIDLGAYDPKSFTLVGCALVGHRDYVFRAKHSDFICYQQRFRNFRLVILLSYFISPATDFSMIAAPMTFRPEEAPNPIDRAFREDLMVGHSAQESVQFFQNMRNIQRDECLVTNAKFAPGVLSPSDEASWIKLVKSRYFRSGVYTNKVIRALRTRFPRGT